MAKKSQTKETVTLAFPQQYIFSCMANRFALQREDGFTLVQFGLISKAGRLLDRFVCNLPADTLASQKENLVQYSDKVGLPKISIAAWTPPDIQSDKDITSILPSIPVVDFIHLTHWENEAEICFWNYSRGKMSDANRAGVQEPITPWGVALLRCGIDLQRAFLAALYEEAP